MRPSGCQTVRKRSQSPASRQIAQFCSNSRIWRSSSISASVLDIDAPPFALVIRGSKGPDDGRLSSEMAYSIQWSGPNRDQFGSLIRIEEMRPSLTSHENGHGL